MKCRICDSENFLDILDLGFSPWCNQFNLISDNSTVQKYPLKLVQCVDCQLVQLTETPKKEVMFSEHQYVSGTTTTLSKHFYDIAENVTKQFNLQRDDFIVDIGGNDGTNLLQYQKLGFENLRNVESAKNIALISFNNRITTDQCFFNEEYVDWFQLACKENQAKIINASGIFFHLEELHSVCRGIKKLLRDDGIFVIQFMYLPDILKNNEFDSIYHEHLVYYNLKTLRRLLQMYDLDIFDAYKSPIHGGSMIAYVTHKNSFYQETYRFRGECLQSDRVQYEELVDFAYRISGLKFQIHNLMQKLKNEGKTIYAIGMPAKSTTLLNYCNIDNTIISKGLESNRLKVGRKSPGTNIPIVEECNQCINNIYHDNCTQNGIPDYYVVLSNTFRKEILEKYKKVKSKFIFLLPKIEIIEN